MKKQRAELKNLTDNYNSERVLRKKYYNMIEDMKGKIRVYCRARPLSQSERARVSLTDLETLQHQMHTIIVCVAFRTITQC